LNNVTVVLQLRERQGSCLPSGTEGRKGRSCRSGSARRRSPPRRPRCRRRNPRRRAERERRGRQAKQVQRSEHEAHGGCSRKLVFCRASVRLGALSPLPCRFKPTAEEGKLSVAGSRRLAGDSNADHRDGAPTATWFAVLKTKIKRIAVTSLTVKYVAGEKGSPIRSRTQNTARRPRERGSDDHDGEKIRRRSSCCWRSGALRISRAAFLDLEIRQLLKSPIAIAGTSERCH
jgi:hypothetical protein